MHAIAAGIFRGEDVGHTLQPTAVVNEVYLRLLDDRGRDWEGRRHFYRVAAKAMRHVLVDHARRRRAKKRPPREARAAFEEADRREPRSLSLEELIAIHHALERLEELDPRQAEVVELRVFAGRTTGEVSASLGVSEATVKRQWRTAKAWLKQALVAGQSVSSDPPDAPGDA